MGQADEFELPFEVVYRRYPVEALERALGGPRERDLTDLLHVGWGVLAKYRAHGLTEAQADRLAVRVGFHPGDVWPEWWHLDP